MAKPDALQQLDPRALRGEDIEVLVDERHFCIVQKPVGVVVVSGRGVPRPTLHELVQERFGKGVLPVHRIDRVTSGCTCFAKSPFGEQAITQAFRRRHVDKRYLAVVEGLPEFSKMGVDARLLRIDAPQAKKGAVAWQTIDDNGQNAMTRLRVLARGTQFSVIEARPETGRMHQIRAHLAHIGFPIVGDKLYGASSSPQLPPHAVMLHAFALSIPKPTGGRAFAVADLPQHWLHMLEEQGIALAPVLERAMKKFGPKKSTKESAPKSKAQHSAPAAPRKGARNESAAPRKGARNESAAPRKDARNESARRSKRSETRGPPKSKPRARGRR